jgi:protein TonB
LPFIADPLPIFCHLLQKAIHLLENSGHLQAVSFNLRTATVILIKPLKLQLMNIFRDNARSLDEILFEKRNRQYGAYVIRSEYNYTVIKSLGITVAAFILTFFGLFQLVNTKEEPAIPYINIPVDITPQTYGQKKKIEQAKIEKPKTTTSAATKSASASTIGTKVVDSTKTEVNPLVTTPSVGSGTMAAAPETGTGTLPHDAPGTNTFTTGGEETVLVPDVPPSFPGLPDFLRNNLVYPPAAFDNNIQGRVAVNFTVDEEGKIVQAKVIQGIGYGCDEEALRVIRLTKWKPGLVHGKPVRVNFNQVITFLLR